MALYIGDELISGDVEGQKINNPFSLLDYKYSEYELSNASWLLSNGQWNSGVVYQSVYDLLLQIYNGTVTKAGVSVKLLTDTYADTDFVLNTTDTTFRLPIKVLMAGSKRVAGNGMTLGWTSNNLNFGCMHGTSGELSGITSAYAKNINTTDWSGTYMSQTPAVSVGITTDETKSGIETSANGLYLYFYVGETVQDANIIAAASVLTDIADLKNASNFSSLGKETIVGWGMPDYSAGVSFTSGSVTPYPCALSIRPKWNGSNASISRPTVVELAGAVYGASQKWKNDTIIMAPAGVEVTFSNSSCIIYPLKGVTANA